MNSYNIYDENHPDCILYHAVAEDEEQVTSLAAEAEYAIDGLVIELDRRNVKDELGRPIKPYIADAMIH